MRCAKKKNSRRSHKDCHFTQVRYRSLADANGGGMTKLRTQRTLKPAYTPAIRAFVEQTVAENLGGEWSAVMGNAIRSYGENIETAERQELHKDITLEQFRVMREFACHSGIVTGAEAAVLRVQRPGPSEPERARGRHGSAILLPPLPRPAAALGDVLRGQADPCPLLHRRPDHLGGDCPDDWVGVFQRHRSHGQDDELEMV